MDEELKKCAWWTDGMQEAYDKGTPLDKLWSGYRARACCEHARAVYCVCEVSLLCPYHGGKCHGSHD